MENEKFLKYYLEIMTSTLSDAVVRNVSLQTNVKMAEEVIKQLEETIIGERKVFQERIIELQDELKSRNEMIVLLNDEIANLNTMRNEYQNVIHQTQHIDTFRNELIECRKEKDIQRVQLEEEIQRLNEKIVYLQASPAKRKKLDLQKSDEQTDSSEYTIEPTETIIKDGGNF